MNALDIITAAIGSGEACAKSSKELQALTGLSERDLRKSIEALRRQGCVILSSTQGYYYPETLSEIRQHIQKESRRARSIEITLISAKELEKALASKQKGR